MSPEALRTERQVQEVLEQQQAQAQQAQLTALAQQIQDPQATEN